MTEHQGVGSLLAPAINLGALVAFLGYKLAGPLKDFARNRQQTIRADLEAARTLLASARTRHEDFSSRLAALGAELSSLRAQAGEDARRAQARIVQAATQAGAAVVADAQAAAGAMRDELMATLGRELGARALARAEEQIRSRLTGEERARLRKEFSAMVEKSP
jgi:F0F1-type ATP synthase membrane subunit b/b'